MNEEPFHPVISEPWTYDLVGMHWKLDPKDDRKDTLDLTLRKDGVVRRLRFLQPHNIKIDQSFHGNLGGFTILDVTSRQWDGINVEVKNYEQDPGLTFVAADVIELGDSDA
jgi:hypothetical protein